MRKYLFLIIFTLTSLSANAYDLSLGAGVFIEKNHYKSENWDITPLPLIRLESEYFFVDISNAGFYLYKGSHGKLKLMADYQTLNFKPDNSNNSDMKKLDKRNVSIMGGLLYVGWWDYGIYKAAVLNDISGNSKGMRAQIGYSLYFKVFEKLEILPEIGIFWHNKQHNNYYYGISNTENMITTFNKYSPENSTTPYASMVILYNFTEHWQITLKFQYSILPNAVTNSPITDKTTGGLIFTGLTYKF